MEEVPPSNTESSDYEDESMVQSEVPVPQELPSITELKEKVLKALRQERHSLAAAMEKSVNWDLNDTELTLNFNSSFESTFIEKESREIESIIQKSLGWTLQIKTLVKVIKEEIVSQEVEDQVELVRNVFRGTIVKRS